MHLPTLDKIGRDLLAVPLWRQVVSLAFSSIGVIAASGCATAVSPATCSNRASVVARAPKNFGQVLGRDGKPTGVYRGADLTNCNQVVFLEEQHIAHILELNASDVMEAQGKHREGRFEVFPIHFSAFTIGTPETCDKVRLALSYLANPDHRPVYVHCSAGRDRTGYVLGMFERIELERSIESIMEELHDFGHRCVWSFLFGQIDKQLAGAAPACK